MVGKLKPPVNAPISRAYVPGPFSVTRPVGIDYAPPPGTPVVASGDGKVVLAREIFVVIKYAHGLSIVVAPLGSLQVREGQTVTAGTTLGTFAPTQKWPVLNFNVSVPGKSRTFGVDVNTAEADPTIYLAR